MNPADASLEGSSRRLSQCAARWSVTIGQRLDGGFRSDVFEGVTEAGDDVVVKLAATRADAAREAGALEAWASTGASVRLLAADEQAAALLLERIRPGTALQGQGPHAADEMAAEILGRLHRGSPRRRALWPSLGDVYPAFEAHSMADAIEWRRAGGDPDRAAKALSLLPRASAEATALFTTSARNVLLHGDFSVKNILAHGSGYVAIDPMPMTGDPASDVGFFAAARPPVSSFMDRAALMATRLGEDVGRAKRWTVIWAVHQAAQAWRPDQDELDRFVTDELARPWD